MKRRNIKRDEVLLADGRTTGFVCFEPTHLEPMCRLDGSAPKNVAHYGRRWAVRMYLAGAQQILGVFNQEMDALRFADVCILRLSRYKKKFTDEKLEYNFNEAHAKKDYANESVKKLVDCQEKRIVEILNVQPVSDEVVNQSATIRDIAEKVNILRSTVYDDNRSMIGSLNRLQTQLNAMQERLDVIMARLGFTPTPQPIGLVPALPQGGTGVNPFPNDHQIICESRHAVVGSEMPVAQNLPVSNKDN